MSTARGGEQSPAEHGSREPGLDHLIRALTADGFPHELAGRDAALAAFRAASREKHRRPRFAPPRGLRMPTRLSTVAAALVAGVTGVTAAAYAQALPAPVQHIAYSVLAPFGVPNSQGPVSPAPSRAAPGSTPGSATTGGHHTASPSPSSPHPTPSASAAKAGSALVLTVGRVRLPAAETDAISGKLTHRGQPEAGVRVRLLEQVAGSPGWRQAGNGVTGPRGRVRFGALRITRNAVFRLAASGGAGSAQVSVTAIPRVQLWLVPGLTTDRLVAAARFGDPGDSVVLQRLSGGTWEAIATQTLGAAHRAIFDVPVTAAAGADYRAVLQATGVHGAGVSGPVRPPYSLADRRQVHRPRHAPAPDDRHRVGEPNRDHGHPDPHPDPDPDCGQPDPDRAGVPVTDQPTPSPVV